MWLARCYRTSSSSRAVVGSAAGRCCSAAAEAACKASWARWRWTGGATSASSPSCTDRGGNSTLRGRAGTPRLRPNVCKGGDAAPAASSLARNASSSSRATKRLPRWRSPAAGISTAAMLAKRRTWSRAVSAPCCPVRASWASLYRAVSDPAAFEKCVWTSATLLLPDGPWDRAEGIASKTSGCGGGAVVSQWQVD